MRNSCFEKYPSMSVSKLKIISFTLHRLDLLKLLKNLRSFFRVFWSSRLMQISLNTLKTLFWLMKVFPNKSQISMRVFILDLKLLLRKISRPTRKVLKLTALSFLENILSKGYFSEKKMWEILPKNWKFLTWIACETDLSLHPNHLGSTSPQTQFCSIYTNRALRIFGKYFSRSSWGLELMSPC